LSRRLTSEVFVPRYYDSLPSQSASCLRNAEGLMTLFKLSTQLVRGNAAFQTGVTCGLHVCHYLEDEVRQFVGQGRATQGWPGGARIKMVREHLMKSTAVLSKCCEKWGQERYASAQIEKGRLAAVAEHARKKLETMGKLAELAECQAVLAAFLVNEGTGKFPPPIPENFGKKVPLAKKVEKSDGDSVEKVEPEAEQAEDGQKTEEAKVADNVKKPEAEQVENAKPVEGDIVFDNAEKSGTEQTEEEKKSEGANVAVNVEKAEAEQVENEKPAEGDIVSDEVKKSEAEQTEEEKKLEAEKKADAEKNIEAEKKAEEEKKADNKKKAEDTFRKCFANDLNYA
jgi:hypothetical protein